MFELSREGMKKKNRSRDISSSKYQSSICSFIKKFSRTSGTRSWKTATQQETGRCFVNNRDPRPNFYTGKNIFESTLPMPSTFLIDRLTPRLPCPLPSSRVSEVHKLRAIRYRIIDQFSKCLPADFHRARLKTLETIKGNPSDG